MQMWRECSGIAVLSCVETVWLQNGSFLRHGWIDVVERRKVENILKQSGGTRPAILCTNQT